MARTHTATLKKYVALERRRRELEDELKSVKAQIEHCSPHVLEWFQATGIQNTNVDGMTVYIKRELWAGRAEEVGIEDFAGTLASAGYGDFVSPRVNLQRLSAWVRELDASGDDIPASIAGVVKVSETFKLQSRKANGS